MTIKCVLFDLDGTLLDTSYDFAYALSKTLDHFKQPRVRYQDVSKTVSQGGLAVTQLGFPGMTGDELEEKRQFFLDIYFNNIAKHTHIFPGLNQGLKSLADQGLPWGIVTNKPEWLTQKLMKEIEFPSQPVSVVAGDTLSVRKPNPEPMFLAAKQCGVEPSECIYLGDHPRDIEAGVNAGMLTGAAMFGYLPEHAEDNAWPADYFFETPVEISEFIEKLK